jgi:hypothetical protein
MRQILDVYGKNLVFGKYLSTWLQSNQARTLEHLVVGGARALSVPLPVGGF